MKVSNIRIERAAPEDCTEADLRLFRDYLLAAGEPDCRELTWSIGQASWLFFAFEARQCVGICALKYSVGDYRNEIFEKAGAWHQSHLVAYEIGWMYVLPAGRGKGVSQQLTQAALAFTDGAGCFATAKATNSASRGVLEKFGFRQLGHAYQSKRGHYSLCLYVNIRF